MNIHCLQHVAIEGPAKIADWASANGHQIRYTHLYRNEKLPEVEAIDWLVIMGGPMNVYEYRNHPWLRAEKRFLEHTIERGKPVLGVCLGSQLLADVLGAKVYQNGDKEIGWLPIQLRPCAETRRFFGESGGELTVFQWHGDTFDLPPGAVHLAESVACRNQAFVCDRRLVGLQFHVEVRATDVESLASDSAGDLTPGRFVQSEKEILRAEPHLASMHRVLYRLLDELETAAG